MEFKRSVQIRWSKKGTVNTFFNLLDTKSLFEHQFFNSNQKKVFFINY